VVRGQQEGMMIGRLILLNGEIRKTTGSRISWKTVLGVKREKTFPMTR
jgi:hypothetical protein